MADQGTVVLTCDTDSRIASGMTELLKLRSGTCFSDDDQRARTLRFSRGGLTIEIPVLTARYSKFLREKFVADMITGHGHLPSDRIDCHLCVAADPRLAKSLTGSVLES